MKPSIHPALIVLILIVGLLVSVTPSFAQGANTTASQPPAGVGILILLMGLAAIGLVGFAYLAQSRADREGDTESDEE